MAEEYNTDPSKGDPPEIDFDIKVWTSNVEFIAHHEEIFRKPEVMARLHWFVNDFKAKGGDFDKLVADMHKLCGEDCEEECVRSFLGDDDAEFEDL